MTRRIASSLAAPWIALAIASAGCDVGIRDYGRIDDGGVASDDGGSSHGLPCDIDQILAASCRSCHGAVLAASAPMRLITLADLTRPSSVDPAKTYAQRSLARMMDGASPMPPPPATPVSASAIATFSAWVVAGTPAGSCGGDGGGVIDDPLNAAPTCTSGSQGTTGESVNMTPGEACISCHQRGEGPPYQVAGTVFATGHEPDRCNGATGAASSVGEAQIVIVGADKSTITLSVQSPSGNFAYQGALAKPYRAKLVYRGRERVMVTEQSSGDCNACHTQQGTNPTGGAPAPGRITLPM
jgi:cytochrome c553